MTSIKRLQPSIRLLIVFAIALDGVLLSATTTSTTVLELSNATKSISDSSDNQSSDAISMKLGKMKSYEVVTADTDDGGPISKKQSIDEQNQFDSLQGHPTGFDFNLDDLEDVHENFKKGDLSDEEEILLRDSDPEFRMTTTTATSTTVLVPMNSVTDKYQIVGDGSNETISQHIYKVSKGSTKQKTKNNEIYRKDDVYKHLESRINSFDFLPYSAENASRDLDIDSSNFFPIMLNLFNHYRWQHGEIRKKVSTACGIELYAYFSALNNNVEWAQKAFDSSGRYRGQFLFGNDLWLGEKVFCHDVNHRTNQSEREQFAFGYFIARISIKSLPSTDEPKLLNVGQCLPQSCSSKDVQAVLELDASVKLLQELTSPVKIQVEVVDVRKVPGEYTLWNDKGFYAFSSIFLIILITTIVSTIYQNWLTSNSHDQSSEKLGKLQKHDPENGKAFELFQIQSLNKSPPMNHNNNNNGNGNLEQERNNPISNNGKITAKTTDSSSNEISSRKKLSLLQQLLLCFDLRSNAMAIFTAESSKEKILSSMHGIKVLSLFWTMLVHVYILLFNVCENRYRRKLYERSFAFQLVINATFSVDTFFFISGVLVTYLFYKIEKQPDKNQNGFVRKSFQQTLFLIFYRYIRLTPAYLFVIFFNRISLQYILNQSIFTPKPIDYPACSKYWWRNILYINNWYPFKEFCMHWSWYLANDMQFYVMATLLLLFSRRYFKFCVTVILIFLCTSWATSGIISLHFNYAFKLAQPFMSFDILYDKPWQRIGSYIVGMITGYVIYSVKTPPRVPFVVNISLWLCTLGVFFALVFGVWTGELGLLSTAFYVGIGHTAWAVGLVWITLSCVWGLLPPLNSILSYRCFLPLSRLTYCTYLIHPVIISITTYSLGGPLNLQHPMILTLYLGNTILSLFAALIISLMFEAPVIKILKILLHK